MISWCSGYFAADIGARPSFRAGDGFASLMKSLMTFAAAFPDAPDRGRWCSAPTPIGTGGAPA